MRKIILTIEDEKTTQKMSATTTIKNINELYEKHGINGITQILLAVNQEINDKTGEDVKISLPNELNILPDGKKW
jgi:hypothetical protein